MSCSVQGGAAEKELLHGAGESCRMTTANDLWYISQSDYKILEELNGHWNYLGWDSIINWVYTNLG